MWNLGNDVTQLVFPFSFSFCPLSFPREPSCRWEVPLCLGNSQAHRLRLSDLGKDGGLYNSESR